MLPGNSHHSQSYSNMHHEMVSQKIKTILLKTHDSNFKMIYVARQQSSLTVLLKHASRNGKSENEDDFTQNSRLEL